MWSLQRGAKLLEQTQQATKMDLKLVVLFLLVGAAISLSRVTSRSVSKLEAGQSERAQPDQ